MPRADYPRSDYVIDIRRQDDGRVRVRTNAAEMIVEGPADDEAAWLEDIGHAIERWTPDTDLSRIVIRSYDTAVDAVHFEPLLAKGRNDRHVIVRESLTRPRSAGLDYAPPLRMVELDLDPPGGDSILPAVKSVFGRHGDEEIAAAMKTARFTLAQVHQVSPEEWPTIDILHASLPLLFSLSRMIDGDFELLEPLQWLQRLTTRAQTRLLVLECSPFEREEVFALAGALTRRGGPAVIVAERGQSDLPRIYWNVIHDQPLDLAVRGHHVTLFGGAGREDALRISSVGLRLMELGRALGAFEVAERRLEVFDVDLLEETARDRIYQRVIPDLQTFKADWDGYEFEFHESDGMIPMSNRLEAMRVQHRLNKPVSFGRIKTFEFPAVPTVNTGEVTPEKKSSAFGKLLQYPWYGHTRQHVVQQPEPRHLNASLWAEARGGGLDRVPSNRGVEPSRVYQLGVQIGPRDRLTVALSAVALFEPVFKWEEGADGQWISIGVTGLDFELLGDGLQEVWLPREGSSEFIYFPIRTSCEAGAARIRVGLFFRNQLVQSIRLAAVVGEPSDAPEASTESRDLLARALGSGDGALPPGTAHATRLEYSLGVAPSTLEDRPSRGVAIVANDLDGSAVISVKAGEKFETRTNANTALRVQKVRDTLRDISFPPFGYAFESAGAPNAGTPEQLETALRQMAARGWYLYDSIIPQSVRAELRAALAPDNQIIHVAHVLLNKAIPWAAIYDRKFEANLPAYDATPASCAAALRPDGTLAPMQCGDHPACPLHKDNVAKVVASGKRAPVPESVACIRHFWGFRHQIEMPAQQVGKDRGDGREQVVRLKVSGYTVLAAALNASLQNVTQHTQALDALTAKTALRATWKAKESQRSRILSILARDGLHVIYFYCHARGGGEEPYLEFRQPGATVEQIVSADLDIEGKWTSAPFVFLNACATAGFSPDALSPFIEKLVQDCGASGVIGTEIAVADMLAADLAEQFLEQFLAGATAGDAMRTVRLRLLAMNNPLGVVYALYSAADLSITRDS